MLCCKKKTVCIFNVHFFALIFFFLRHPVCTRSLWKLFKPLQILFTFLSLFYLSTFAPRDQLYSKLAVLAMAVPKATPLTKFSTWSLFSSPYRHHEAKCSQFLKNRLYPASPSFERAFWTISCGGSGLKKKKRMHTLKEKLL